MNCWSKNRGVILIMFNTGHALPLVETRILRPRMVRGADAQQPRRGDGSRPQQWPVRDLDFAAIKPQSRTLQGRAHITVSICPRPQTWQQVVRERGQAPSKPSLGQAMATNSPCPSPVREFGEPATTGRPLTKTGRGLCTAKAWLHHHIGAFFWPPTEFPIHIKLAPIYGLI
jgi:hypothetical protein